VVLLEKASFSEIYARLIRKMEEIDHFPSINPVLGGRITDRFGFRVDPYTRKWNIHQGVDIPAYKGTSVLATADGIVKEAKIEYTPHKDYGREIIVDHGFGYETRYAHLSKILVYKGQRIKRWEIIGEVGDTGKATGDHLHYEVIYSAERQNPENFIYN
jgi:murein DD-endopeptidase MepM/ murein hydrolase activator NlpD